MATPGQLIRIVSVVTGLDKATIFEYDRKLVAAGLRTKGGRGPHLSAKVTPLDAARLLVAVLGSDMIKDAVKSVKRYSGTVAETVLGAKHASYASWPWEALSSLPADHSFTDALAALVGMAMVGDGLPPMSVMATAETSGTWADLKVNSGDLGVTVRYLADWRGKTPGPPIQPRGSFFRTATITEFALRPIGKVIVGTMDDDTVEMLDGVMNDRGAHSLAALL